MGYEPKVKVLCGAKDILKFLKGQAIPTELATANGVFMKAGTIDKPATEKEIENGEMKMDMYKQSVNVIHLTTLPAVLFS